MKSFHRHPTVVLGILLLLAAADPPDVRTDASPAVPDLGVSHSFRIAWRVHEDVALARLTVLDSLGREVATMLVNEKKTSGTDRVAWSPARPRAAVSTSAG